MAGQLSRLESLPIEVTSTSIGLSLLVSYSSLASLRNPSPRSLSASEHELPLATQRLLLCTSYADCRVPWEEDLQ